MIWIGLDGDDFVSSHLGYYAKLRNIERDPRIALSFDAPFEPGAMLQNYAVLHGRATAPVKPGCVLRYTVDRITGVGPWAPGSH